MKQEWEQHVEQSEDTSTLSALIHKSVQKETTGECDVTKKYEEVYEELSNLPNTVGSINSNLQALRTENIDTNEFEDGLDTVIGRMEELHGRTDDSDE